MPTKYLFIGNKIITLSNGKLLVPEEESETYYLKTSDSYILTDTNRVKLKYSTGE